MPTTFTGALAFVLGFWLALQLLLPLVAPQRGEALAPAPPEAERAIDSSDALD